MNRFGNKKISLILIFFFIIVGIIYAVYNLFFIPMPVVEGIDAFNFLPVEKTVTIKGKNLKSIEISINQGIKNIELLKDRDSSGEKTYILQIKPKSLELSDGSAIVIINARAGILKKIKYEITSNIDTVPPALEVLNAPSIIDHGGGGFALLRAKDADSVFVKLEDRIFKAFKVAETYFVFFPAPFDIKDGSIFYAIAEDAAGNRNIRSLPTKLKSSNFKISTMNIDDSFINQVVSPLLNETNISDPISAFKKVNEDLRENSLKKLIEIAQKTEPEILWEGPFLQLKNSKVMAKYGDKRDYFYNGKFISKSVHLGYDLASTTNAPVEAANRGVVKFVGDLGIYGNTVIIDHGLGLMSLYGHLSTAIVKEGQIVKKGEVIGKTGSTGLAGGDHLHFGILIHGYEVSPLHWWDAHWIKVNVLDYLKPHDQIV